MALKRSASHGTNFTSSGRSTRLPRRYAYGAHVCKDSISVSTGDHSKVIEISVTGRTRKSDVPANPVVSSTRPYNSNRNTSEYLSSCQTWKLKVQVLLEDDNIRVITRYQERLSKSSLISKHRNKDTLHIYDWRENSGSSIWENLNPFIVKYFSATHTL